MAGAYSTFANEGVYNKPQVIRYVKFPPTSPYFKEFGEVYSFATEPEQVMKESTAYIISNMLKTTNEGSYTAKAGVSGYNVYAKTGSSNFESDNAKKIDDTMTRDH